MKKQFLIMLACILCLFSGRLQAQGLTIVALPVVVSEMAAHDIYESETVGIANARSKQFARYQQLVSIATDAQLLSLANTHPNAVVRLYAYQALRERNIAIPKALLQKFNEDETLVQTLEGCIANKFPVSKLAGKHLSAKSQYSRPQLMQFASN